MSIRKFKTEERIQIAFSFRGVECRELLPPCSITKSALAYAAGLRAEIQRKIADDEFRYTEHFPESQRAAQFDELPKHVLLGKLIDKQIETYASQVANGTLAQSTHDGYVKALTSTRMKHWRTKAIGSVTPSMLRAWISDLAVTAKFARNLLTPFRSVFEDALNDDLIKFDPFERIALTKLLKQTATDSKYVVDPFTEAERAQLVAAARPDEWPTVQFWLETGVRPGELQALRWSRANLAAGKVRIDLNQVAGQEKGPKTEAGVRDVELSDLAMAALEAQKLISLAADGHIFLNPRTGKPWTTDAQLRKGLWVPLLARSGVRYRNPYQARHTYASARLTAGANPWWLAEQLGHVDVQMVFQTYGKFIPEDYQKPKAPRLKAVA
ncbi:integrase [Variovorax sp. UMC13]|nr:integrase [Variovorax sp. UMC13]